MKINNKNLSSLISAGFTSRWHTLPMNKTQNVGEHCYGMMVIAKAWYKGNVPEDVTNWILFHDSAESLVGDVPWSAKNNYPKLKESLKEAEGDALYSDLGISLSIESNDTLRIIDRLEAAHFFLQELLTGNRHPAIIKTAKEFSGLLRSMRKDYLKVADRSDDLYVGNDLCISEENKVPKHMDDFVKNIDIGISNVIKSTID